MVKEHLLGLTVGNIKENMSMIKNKDMEFLNGLMEELTTVSGLMENNMELELI